MRRRAVLEYEENNIDKPSINIKIDFVDLKKTTKYKYYSYLQDVSIGDTVTVILDSMRIKIRVIKTVYNSLSNEFTKLELGEFKANYITDTQKNVSSIVKKETDNLSTTILEQAQSNATNLIKKATNGYIVLRPVENPSELLIMDTDNPNTCKKVWRYNMNGWGYSKNGINGPYELAATMDGSLVASMIKTRKYACRQNTWWNISVRRK